MTTTNPMPLLDLAPERDSILEDVLEGLSQNPKRLPSKYFYDRRGSDLFDAICELPEYYPTRTELGIMRNHSADMADIIGEEACVIEIGSGSGIKTKLLLRGLENPLAYIPIDISRDHLLDSAEILASEFSNVEITPICADFLQPLTVPEGLPECQNFVIYFPGSTLGNLTHRQADVLLEELAAVSRQCTANSESQDPARGGLLLGIDLQKDVAVLEAAYNDSQNVTAEFNLNILRHINDRLDCQIPVSNFKHSAPYNATENRIEMHLVAKNSCRFQVGDEEFRIRLGESILTEYSHKYDLTELSARLDKCGWKSRKVWTDPKNYFAVIYCDLKSK